MKNMTNTYCQSGYCNTNLQQKQTAAADVSFADTLLHAAGFIAAIAVASAMIWFTYLG